MAERIYLSFTMDCERLHRDHQLVSRGEGPLTWEASEGAITRFAEIVESHGGRATLYSLPESARHHPALYRNLASRGHQLGLHLHPCVFGEIGTHQAGLARYPLAQQRQLLSAARDAWAEAIGQAPQTFRPGNFSANDDTFQACTELGMDHGSVSCPHRDAPHVAAVWTGAPVWPVVRRGFTDVPLTTSPKPPGVKGFPYEVRIERTGDSPDDMPLSVAAKRLDEFADWPADVPRCLVSLTHSSVPYHEHPPRELAIIEELVRMTQTRAAQSGWDVEIVPVSTVVEALRELGR
jgi:hypothetical protein